MGACWSCCAPPGDELPALSAEDIERLRNRGYLPAMAGPSVDFEGNNQLQTVYAAEYENGAEITLLFADEDRPNACTDCLYDTIRRPLFGRRSDIETVLIIGDEMVFPGTYSADQTWDEKMPSHNETSLPLSQFEKDGDGSEFILWINTWNHLLGEKNNNPGMAITIQHAKPTADAPASVTGTGFIVRKGSRAEVDARFNGLMTTVSTVMTDERKERLGKRLA
jgi:hypothetical protein